jgi:hypothetical protein
LKSRPKVKDSGNNVNLCRDFAFFARCTPQYCQPRLRACLTSRMIRPRLEGFRP